MLTLFTEFKNIILVKRYCKNRRASFCDFDVDFLFNWIQYSRSDVSVTPVAVFKWCIGMGRQFYPTPGVYTKCCRKIEPFFCPHRPIFSFYTFCNTISFSIDVPLLQAKGNFTGALMCPNGTTWIFIQQQGWTSNTKPCVLNHTFLSM